MRARIAVAVLVLMVASAGRADFRQYKNLPADPSLASRLRYALEPIFKQYPKLKREDLAISVIDITNRSTPSRADFNGDVPFYPASVIKLFFMAETFAEKKETVADVDRALREMIVVSDNDATAYIVDVVSGTAAGPQLDKRGLRKFLDARKGVNRYFGAMGYDVSAIMKPWSFGPYGRELQLLGENRENRNRATANEVTALMYWIVSGRAVSKEASRMMLALLERPLDPVRADENQVKEFIGEALPKGAKLWSKAGWTSEVRHDAAYVELPDGRRYVLTIFTRGLGDDVTIVPFVAKTVLAELDTTIRP